MCVSAAPPLCLTPVQAKVLLYDANRQPLAQAKVTSKFAFHAQDDLYASFVDDTRQNWSIHFESEDQV